MPFPDPIQAAALLVRSADALLIGAGAGMGVDSGLPDFRGPEGFWRAYPPLAKLGIRFEEMANPYWFEKDPKLAWAFYGHRLKLYRETEPHKGFKSLLRIASNMPHGYFVFTSNVDGHFQKAGFDENSVVECHGSIHHLQCTLPCHGGIWSADGVHITVDMESFTAKPPLPSCPRCGSLARPNVLMFGDFNWVPDRTEAQEERFHRWLSSLKGKKLAIIEVGAGTAVPTVRYLCQSVASRFETKIIRINPRECSETPRVICIRSGAAAALSALEDLILGGG